MRKRPTDHTETKTMKACPKRKVRRWLTFLGLVGLGGGLWFADGGGNGGRVVIHV